MEKSDINSIQVYIANAIDGVSSQELENIHLCRDSIIFQLNLALRARMCLEYANSFLQSLDDAFMNYKTKDPLIVYRGFNYKEMIRYFHNGYYFDFGYMSTSCRIKTAIDFLSEPAIGYFPAFLRISLPRDTNAILIDEIQEISSHYEDEVLLKRNSMFKVTKNIEANISDILDEPINSTIRVCLKNRVKANEFVFFGYEKIRTT